MPLAPPVTTATLPSSLNRSRAFGMRDFHFQGLHSRRCWCGVGTANRAESCFPYVDFIGGFAPAPLWPMPTHRQRERDAISEDPALRIRDSRSLRQGAHAVVDEVLEAGILTQEAPTNHPIPGALKLVGRVG